MSLQVMSVVPLEKGKARIRFDDGTEVVLYKGEIRKLGIEEGCVVTEAVYDKILNANALESVQSRGQCICWKSRTGQSVSFMTN